MPKLRALTEAPPDARGDAENQLAELRDYLLKVVEELEYLLTHLEADNINDTTFERIRSMIPTGYSGLPVMDGTASSGGSGQWARGDHVHPTDTSRAADSALTAHAGDTSNPHGVTAAQAGAVPATREINGYPLSADVTLDYSDVGAVPATREINGQSLTDDITLDADDVGARPDDWMPSAADVGAQPEIDVSGILKGDGNGGVSAAVAGTDYQTPLAAGTDYATPAMIPAISAATPQMDGTAAAGSTGDVSDAGHVHPSDTNKADLGLLAYVETGSTASRAYAVGEYFCWGGKLYRAKTAISSGATITVGTNCEQTTVASMPGYLLLWTNSNTGSTFAAQDIPGTGGFRLYLVVCRITTSSQGYVSYWLNCDTGEMQNITFVSSPASTVPYISFRQVTKQQLGLLNISDCDTRAITATSRSQDNSQLIPYKIFGIY